MNCKRSLEFLKAAVIIGGKRSWRDWRGWDPLIIYIHAYHETGGFESVIGGHNYWGIKVPKSWTGKVLSRPTWEHIRGKDVTLVDQFIDFDSLEAAITWYIYFIKRVYPQSYRSRRTYARFFYRLNKGKYQYASDPKHTEKLIRLYEGEINNVLGEVQT
jgi:flagellar protein FlgJ